MTPKPQQKFSNRPRLNGFWLGVTLVVFAIVLMAWRTWHSYVSVSLPQVSQKLAEQFPTAQPFRDLHKTFEEMGKKDSAPKGTAQAPAFAVYSQVAIQAFNPSIGPANAPVTLVVMGHAGSPRSLALLNMARKAQALDPMQVRVVMKFLATDEGRDDVEAGLFGAVAHDYSKFWDFINALTNRPEGHAPDLLGAMETLGVSLQDMRQRLDRNTAAYMRQIGQDIEDAKAVNLEQGPVVYVNQLQLPATVDSSTLNAQVQAALGRR